MSEDNKIPPAPPPDDFSKTTPNIRPPENETPQSDWEKTNYNFPKQPEADDWGKTVTNVKPIDTGRSDFDKTFYPGTKPPATPEWGTTDADVKVNAADFGTRPEDFGTAEPGYDKTSPYFRLPEAERAKYQDLPPTPTENAERAEQEKQAKGGLPRWFWVFAGLMTMFFFAIVVFAIVYFVITRDTAFEVTVKGAPLGSTIQVDGSPLAVTDEDGSFRLKNLKAGEREISIVNPNYNCEKRKVTGGNGVNPDPIIARCTPIATIPTNTPNTTDDCGNIHFGEDDKAERCYNAALDALPDPFTAEDLVKALNILIINFDSGKSDIPGKRLQDLKKGAGFIQKLPAGIVLEVGGHTDNVGKDAKNQPLSESRAEAVKKALVGYGVRADMLQTRGYGSTRPITTNDTIDGKYRNRRIEYSIVKK